MQLLQMLVLFHISIVLGLNKVYRLMRVRRHLSLPGRRVHLICPEYAASLSDLFFMGLIVVKCDNKA